MQCFACVFIESPLVDFESFLQSSKILLKSSPVRHGADKPSQCSFIYRVSECTLYSVIQIINEKYWIDRTDPTRTPLEISSV